MDNKVKLVDKYINNREETYQYHLYHTYDIKPSKTYFESNLHPEALQGLIAYIEFHAVDIPGGCSMEAVEILEVIDELFANIKIITELTGEFFSINHFTVWEYFCGSEIEHYDGFDNTGLMEYLLDMSIRNEWELLNS